MRIKIFGINFYLKREATIVFIAILTLAIFITVFIVSNNKNKIIISKDNSIEIVKSESTAEEEISIYVVGCVKETGVYKIKKGQIVDELVKMAGGFTENADVLNINLVYKLEENMMIKVLDKNDDEKAETGEGGTGLSITRGLSEELESGLKGGPININTAGKELLMTLPGIGESRAMYIINYRNEHGKFLKIEDIMNVKDIKDGRFLKMKDMITVD
jgi:competence protein ComEA